MRIRIAAMLGLAAGLVAPTVMAQPTPSAAGGPTGMAGKPGMKSGSMRGIHHMPAHHGGPSKPDTSDTMADQLNSMSLQSAQKGQPYSPPAGQK